MPIARRRDQLVFDIVPARNRSLLSADSREVQYLFASARRMASRGELSRRVAAPCTWRSAAKNSTRSRHPIRKDRLGTSSDWRWRYVGRNARHRNWTSVLRRRRRNVHGCRCEEWQTVVAFSSQSNVESFADGLSVRWKAVSGRHFRPHSDGIWALGLNANVRN